MNDKEHLWPLFAAAALSCGPPQRAANMPDQVAGCAAAADLMMAEYEKRFPSKGTPMAPPR